MILLRGYIIRVIVCKLSSGRIMDKIQKNSTRHFTSTYEEAVTKLNSLQSNAAVLEKILKERDKLLQQNITHVEECLHKVGVEIGELNNLNVIHISGTKGKGSTSAFCESILRHHGYKTGFYSSPHLVVVRERIRINGSPISQDMFTSYFWHIYNILSRQKKNEADMPAYFKFLTVMAYYVFLKEKVDVAIMEVGIGGEYDSTNVIKSPIVCGITSLGLDHIKVLGDTIEKIAWQKAGIFKPGVLAYTVPQPLSALKVLTERAKEIGTKLFIVPSLDSNDWRHRKISLGLSGHVQFVNASLAIQLASSWMDIINKEALMTDARIQSKNGSHLNSNGLLMARPIKITDQIAQGLSECHWAGRSQILKTESAIYFLDGAHTDESIEACKIWFEETTNKTGKAKKVFRILIFNLMGYREPENLLKPLARSKFNLAIFCPNFAHVSHHDSSDQNAVAAPWNVQMKKCNQNNLVWQNMMQYEMEDNSTSKHISINQNGLQSTPVISYKKENSFHPNVIPSIVLPCIHDVVKWISCRGDLECELPIKNVPKETLNQMADAYQIHVLVTGSLHLVGGFLGVLEPYHEQKSSILNDQNKMHNGYRNANFCTPGSP